MKKTVFYISLIAIILFCSACESFLDIQPLEVPETEEDVFVKRFTVEKYLLNVYRFVPKYSQSSANGAEGEPWVAASDEGDQGASHTVIQILNGTWNPSNIPYDKWNRYWQGIREATYFMQNVGICKDLTEDYLTRYYNEARFLRAYYYFLLMRLYGPVVILPNEVPIDPNSEYFNTYFSRDSWDECVQYVCDELDEAAKGLKQDLILADMGRPTPGAAMALKSRLLLYSASQLFNPRSNSLYGNWKSKKTNDYLIPVTYNSEKWKKAADAAKAVIDYTFNGEQAYALVEKSDGGILNPYKSLYGIFQDKWNSTETIFGRALNEQSWYQRCISRSVNNNCWAIVNPSQKLVDAYAMNNGVYPIIGYQDASSTYDGGEKPIFDSRVIPKNNSIVDVIDPDFEPSTYFEATYGGVFPGRIGHYDDYTHPFDGRKRSIVKMWAEREPRFYVDIAYNQMDYPVGMSGDGWGNATNWITLNHEYNGSGGLPLSSHSATGYCQRKNVNREVVPLATNTNWAQPFVWVMIRLGEIYLNYVEALIEYDPTHPDIFEYWNKIRSRAGVPDIQEVYPEVIGNQERMRELYRRERMIELALENHRYFDTRRWQIAERTNNGMLYGMNIHTTVTVPMGIPQTENMANGVPVPTFYKRTMTENGNRIFLQKHYLWPINQTELNRNRNIEQAPGW